MRAFASSLVLALVAAASVSAQTLYVPAAANAEGANQTQWRTDLQVKAAGGEGAEFTIDLLQQNTDNSSRLTLEGSAGPGQSVRFANLLDSGFMFTGTGALRVVATSGQILVTSRTYNDDPNGTYGQNVPAVAEEDATPFGSQVSLIQLSRSSDSNAGFRTNIGFVNVTGQEITIEVDLHLADGTLLGTVTRVLLPLDYQQIFDVFAAAGAEDVDDGYAVVRTTTEGGSFVTYASVVDNRSGDAVFILGQVDEQEAPPEQRLVVFEAFIRPG